LQRKLWRIPKLQRGFPNFTEAPAGLGAGPRGALHRASPPRGTQARRRSGWRFRSGFLAVFCLGCCGGLLRARSTGLLLDPAPGPAGASIRFGTLFDVSGFSPASVARGCAEVELPNMAPVRSTEAIFGGSTSANLPCNESCGGPRNFKEGFRTLRKLRPASEPKGPESFRRDETGSLHTYGPSLLCTVSHRKSN